MTTKKPITAWPDDHDIAVIVTEDGVFEGDDLYPFEIEAECYSDSYGDFIAPEGWEFVYNRSGQDRYTGHVFHSSETPHLGMVKGEPGEYIVSYFDLVHNHEPTDECPGDDPTGDGWVMLKKVNGHKPLGQSQNKRGDQLQAGDIYIDPDYRRVLEIVQNNGTLFASRLYPRLDLVVFDLAAPHHLFQAFPKVEQDHAVFANG